MTETQKLTQILTEKGYSTEQIATILQWLQDEKEGNVISAEEMYASLFSTKKVYA